MFCRVVYDVERTVAALGHSRLESAAVAALIQLLRTGQPSLYLAGANTCYPANEGVSAIIDNEPTSPRKHSHHMASTGEEH